MLSLAACGNDTSPGSSSNITPSPGQLDTTEPPPDIISASGRTIVISDTEGNDVRMTRGDDREYSAQAGARMSDGYLALTGAESHISMLLDGESTVKTDELTKVAVERLSSNKLTLALLEGAIIADIAPLKSGDSMEFKAGNVSFGIRGTSFIMEHRDADTVVVIMLSGSGYIDDITLLEAGHIATVKSGDTTITPLVINDSLSAFALYEIEQRDEEWPASDQNDDALIRALLDGTYEGELDANGKFTGYGVWAYHQYRYEGDFANGFPNGTGSLQISMVCGGHDDGMRCAILITTHGTFVNGYAHGPITHVWNFCTGHIATWNYVVDMGYPTETGRIASSDDDPHFLMLREDSLISVSPFAGDRTHRNTPRP